MATLYTHKDRNILKTWLFMVMFFAVVIGVGWAVSWYYRNTAILYVAVAFSVFMNVLSYWYSDTIVLRMAGARPV
ncbi:MAG: zinc metalloprotease HtpX, partial [Candidatus Yonathbacteria bacterium CG_4_9_14_0_8_um_filter_46_47]